MPWTTEDVDKHNKNLSQGSKERWTRIANAVLSSSNDEGLAIKTANARVKPSNKEAIKRRLYG